MQTMFKAKFPIYALRKYSQLGTEGVYSLIHTHFTTYILDIPDLEGDYSERRLKMLGMELPYPIYPLKERFSTLSQMANSKRRVFIDATGKLFKYKPTKFFKVRYVKVLRASRTWNGYYLLMTKLPVFFTAEEVPKYIGYIQIGAAYYIYDYSDELKPTVRRKL